MRPDALGFRFIRWGAGFLVLGLFTGYGPLGHYLQNGIAISCPWAPVHAHVALLGWVGMTLFGLVYRTMTSLPGGAAFPVRIASGHFYCCVIGVLGVWVNGMLGYRIIDLISDQFYYRPDTPMLNLWLSIDGAFLSLYGIGAMLFLAALARSTAR